MSKTLTIWLISVFSVIRHPVLPRNTHKYVLKKWGLSVPFLLSLLVSLGGPTPDSSADMEQLQFALGTELMAGGSPGCARTWSNTPKVGPNPPSSYPWKKREPPCPSWQPARQVFARHLHSLLRKLFHLLEEKLGFSGLRRDRET